MNLALENRRVFLTGASRGIGLAIAQLFLENGAQVIGAAKDRARLSEAAAKLGQISSANRFHPVVLDLGSGAFENEAARAVAKHFGGELDLLINNAAVMA